MNEQIKLVALRHQYGYKVEEIAEKVNLKPRTIYEYEKGKGNITLKKAREIADIYEKSVDDIDFN